MATIGLVVHQERGEAAKQANELAAWLGTQGHSVVVPTEDEVIAGMHCSRVPAAAFADSLDLAVSLGGDGSILRAVELVAEGGVPVLGVNFGQLGYLAAIEPQQSSRAVERFLAGAYDLEERMMLEVTHAGETFHALNELVLERQGGDTTIRIGVTIDEEFFANYSADGMIVATPTGSTAYAFSARGPFVDATHRSMQLTPVSPHMLFDRTLVMSPDTDLELEVKGHRSAALVIDGRTIAAIDPGNAIRATGSSRVAKLVTLGPRNFHKILKQKFSLGDR